MRGGWLNVGTERPGLRWQVGRGKALMIACVYAAIIIVAHAEALPENGVDASLGID